MKGTREDTENGKYKAGRSLSDMRWVLGKGNEK